MSKTLRNILIGIIIVLAVICLFVIGRLSAGGEHSNASSHSQQTTKTSESSDKKVANKGNFSIAELKNNPKESAVAIVYYGVKYVSNNQTWHNIFTDGGNGFTISVKTVDQNTAKYYVETRTDTNKDPNAVYYSLVGNDHNEVAFYDSQDNELLKVSLKAIQTYANQNFSEADMAGRTKKVDIIQASGSNTTSTPGTDLVADAQNDPTKYAEEIMTYAEQVNIATEFNQPLWWDKLDQLKSHFGGYYHIYQSSDTGEFSLDTQAGGGLGFDAPQNGNVKFFVSGGPSASGNGSQEVSVDIAQIEAQLDSGNTSLVSVKLSQN
ncbi:hypothetical protein [Furfurilactobacillus curtus]|uniref:DUF4767 domain-containing protein n=1 Tax=Furfurilactobacillus curtus TaxID=1746200 RepID=A0ABQ5JP58_9LACO